MINDIECIFNVWGYTEIFPQLLLKVLYLKATLTFLRFAAKHCSIAQLFERFLSAIRSYMLHIPNCAKGNCLITE